MNAIKNNLTKKQLERGVPVLRLRCIETYSDAKTNKELFTKDYVYHVFVIHRTSIEIQTNLFGYTAEVPMSTVKQIFAGFGKKDSEAVKSV